MLLDLLFTEFQTPVQVGYVSVSDFGNQLGACDCSSNGINSYILGNLIGLSAKFLDQNMEPIDPSTVTLYVQNPWGTVTEYVYGDSSIIRDGQGLYHFDLANTISGYYLYRYEGSGNVVCAQNGQINSVFSPIGSLS